MPEWYLPIALVSWVLFCGIMPDSVFGSLIFALLWPISWFFYGVATLIDFFSQE